MSILVREITEASQDQSQGIAQINEAVAEIDTMTQQNAALVEESTAAAQTLREGSFKVLQSVNLFQMERGTARTTGLLAITRARA